MKNVTWNPVFNLIIEIKNNFINKFGPINEYKKIINKKDCTQKTQLEYWIEKINEDKYNNFIAPLQVNQYNEFILIRYGLHEMVSNLWEDPDSIYRECRSITIDIKNEKIVLCPFKKFFNIDEVNETKIDVIKNKLLNAKLVEITDKLDGSMQAARWYNNDIFMSGSMSLDRNSSWRLDDGYEKLTNEHVNMMKENDRFTFIFEYISLKDAHVVKYSKSDEGLYLLGMRDVYDGEQLPYRDVYKFSQKYNVKMAQIENKTIDEILELSKVESSDKKEGWVINIDGHLIKLKCDDYVKLHGILNSLSSTNTIIKAIAHNTMDDLISKIPKAHKSRIITIANFINEYKSYIDNLVDMYYKKAPQGNKKEFMIYVTKNVPRQLQGYVRLKFSKTKYNILCRGKKEPFKYIKINDIFSDINELKIDIAIPESLKV